ncbi:HPr family phosphocarrier protein [Brotaphodocola sp.]|uniref:HPr family phosphocarrier protein n=1 Tax=Brotaphodocola sp. TaxID=3073577 RepID=UPI003D7C8C98
MTWFQYVISDPAGMHARSAAAISRLVEPFQSQVRIRLKRKEVDAGRVMALMGLKAKCGDRIEIQAEGPDEQEAIRILQASIPTIL